MAKKKLDTTETGYATYRQLQAANQEVFTPATKEEIAYAEEAQRRSTAISNSSAFNPAYSYEGPVESPISREENYWGNSMFDNGSANAEEFRNLSDIRAENEPWYAKILAGLSKGALTAVTTFVGGTAGLLYGAEQAIQHGEFSKVWDNDVMQAVGEISQEMENWMPNYRTTAEQQDPWYEHIFSANFLGDTIIKNAGFTVGAFYSGGVVAGGARLALRAAARGALKAGARRVAKGILKHSPLITGLVGSTTSAISEGSIEAVNNSRDWFNLQKAQLEDARDAIITKAAEDYGTESLEYMNAIRDTESAYNTALAQASEDRIKMGNADLLMNIPILTASNYLQFAKLYAGGYKTARRANNIVNRGKFAGMTYKQAMTAGKAQGLSEEAIRAELAQFASGSTKAGAKVAAVKGILSEGFEEINQKAASEIAGNYYATDVNNFWKARTDPEASQETLSWIKSVGEGIAKTYTDVNSWEEFFVGALMGGVGMPSFRGIHNAEGKLQSPLYFRGGARGEYKAYKEQDKRNQEIANYINKRLSSPDFVNYYQGLVRHTKYQSLMDAATERGDNFEFKNSEHAQLVSDIVMFDNAGRLQDLLDIVDSNENISDEDIEKLRAYTTATVDNSAGIEDLKQRKEKLQQDLDQFKAARERINNGFYEDNNGVTGEQIKAYELKSIDKTIEAFEAEITEIDTQLTDPSSATKKVGPYIDENGNEVSNAVVRDKIRKQAAQVKKTINDYRKAKEDLDIYTGEALTDDQLEELTWMKTQLKNWSDRAEDLGYEVQEMLSDVLIELRAATLPEDPEDDTPEDAALRQNLDPLYFLLKVKPKAVAALLSSNTKLAEALQEILGMEELTSLDALERASVLDKLNDLIRIGNASNLYNKKLKEYLADPAKQKKEHDKVKEETEAKISEAKIESKIAHTEEKSVKELADEIEGTEDSDDEFSLSDDDLAFLQDEQEKQRAKAAKQNQDEAKKFNDTKGRLARKVAEKAKNDEEAKDAATLVDEAIQGAEGVDDLLDIDGEAYNDASAIELSEGDIAELSAPTQEDLDNGITVRSFTPEEAQNKRQERLDRAKAVIKEAIDEIKEEDEYKENLPQGNHTPQSDSEETGRDPVDKGEPVNDKAKKDDKEKKQPGTPTPTISAEEASATIDEEMAHRDPTPNKEYWKNNTTEVALHSRRGEQRPYHETMTTRNEEDRKRQRVYEAVWNYLRDKGAFKAIKSGAAKAGSKVTFGFSKELNDQVAKILGRENPILLIFNEHGQVIGDMISPLDSRTFSTYPGLEAAYNEAVKQYNEAKESSTEDIVRTTLQTTISRNLIGQPEYLDSSQRSTLNDIFSVQKADGTLEQRSPIIGLATTSGANSPIYFVGGRGVTDSRTDEERAVQSPLNAKKNQPYVLIETSDAKRKYVCVPIVTPTYDPNMGGKLASIINQHFADLVKVLQEAPNLEAANQAAMEWKDQLQEMLALAGVYVEIDNRGNLKIRCKKNTTDIAWTTVYTNTITNYNANEVARAFAGTPIQISRRYLGREFHGEDYNKMIGEIAHANVASGATHTINDFFTLNPIINGVEQKAKSPKSTRTNPTPANKNRVSITLSNGSTIIYDTKTNSVYLNGKDITSTLDNEHKASYFGRATGQNMEGSYQTPWGYYNAKTHKFEQAPDPNAVIAAKAVVNLGVIPNQSRVDRSATDSESYTIADYKGNKQKYKRVHAVLGSNFSGTERVPGRAIETGNAVDSIVRDIFSNKTPEKPANMTQEAFDSMVKQMTAWRDFQVAKGWTFYANNLVVFGNINGERVAGELDVLAIDPKGNFHILDMKTSAWGFNASPYFANKGENQRMSTREYYSRQLSIYKTLFEQQYGIKVNTLRIIPFNISYESRDSKLVIAINKENSMALDDYSEEYKEKKEEPKKDSNSPVKSDNANKENKTFDRQAALTKLKGYNIFKSPKQQALLDNISDENLAKLASISKPFIRQLLSKYDLKVSKTASVDEINAAIAELLNPNKAREATQPVVKPFNRKREERKVARMLPQLAKDRTRIVDTLIKINKSGRLAWGRFRNGIVTLYKGYARGTYYHESFHFVFNSLMTKQELDRAYKAAEKQFGKKSFLALEEDMAEDFREYMQNEESFVGILKNTWRKFGNWVKGLFGKENYLDNLYASISRGDFSTREVSEESANLKYQTDKRVEEDVHRKMVVINRLQGIDAEDTAIKRSKAIHILHTTYDDYDIVIKRKESGEYYCESVNHKSDITRFNEVTPQQIAEYHKSKLYYANLEQSAKQYLEDKDISQEEYNDLSQDEKETLIYCRS